IDLLLLFQDCSFWGGRGRLLYPKSGWRFQGRTRSKLLGPRENLKTGEQKIR
ncbi:hypothetical protein X975_27049, partial [Stegodyphus mimosarum]